MRGWGKNKGGGLPAVQGIEGTWCGGHPMPAPQALLGLGRQIEMPPGTLALLDLTAHLFSSFLLPLCRA